MLRAGEVSGVFGAGSRFFLSQIHPHPYNLTSLTPLKRGSVRLYGYSSLVSPRKLLRCKGVASHKSRLVSCFSRCLTPFRGEEPRFDPVGVAMTGCVLPYGRDPISYRLTPARHRPGMVVLHVSSAKGLGCLTPLMVRVSPAQRISQCLAQSHTVSPERMRPVMLRWRHRETEQGST